MSGSPLTQSHAYAFSINVVVQFLVGGITAERPAPEIQAQAVEILSGIAIGVLAGSVLTIKPVR